jgi:hypothetical protein
VDTSGRENEEELLELAYLWQPGRALALLHGVGAGVHLLPLQLQAAEIPRKRKLKEATSYERAASQVVCGEAIWDENERERQQRGLYTRARHATGRWSW